METELPTARSERKPYLFNFRSRISPTTAGFAFPLLDLIT
jgi:hypothetical protein